MVEFRDVVKKYAGTDEALGVPAGTVGGIPVVTPDDLGPAAAMTPAEVVTDPDAQAALSGAFALALPTWAAAEMWALDNVVRNADGVVTSADITWPDESAGTFTGTPNLTFGALDAWTATHTDSGQQVRQPTVTRNADGDITDAPALIVEVIP